eukprot:TRINITY_DN551_c0_g1_i10.p1 TRINITY_DN551_c0_g1~~TRINITY_DN551_c0_g1_i10.p1  ORF type:complete len:170 (+),score=11.07 TRINITY_DN551_c0_g1_i10:173-682(+)
MYRSLPSSPIPKALKYSIVVFCILSGILTVVAFFLNISIAAILMIPFKFLALCGSFVVATDLYERNNKVFHLISQISCTAVICANCFCAYFIHYVGTLLPFFLFDIIFVIYIVESSSLFICNMLSYAVVVLSWKYWRRVETSACSTPTSQPYPAPVYQPPDGSIKGDGI